MGLKMEMVGNDESGSEGRHIHIFTSGRETVRRERWNRREKA